MSHVLLLNPPDDRFGIRDSYPPVSWAGAAFNIMSRGHTLREGHLTSTVRRRAHGLSVPVLSRSRHPRDLVARWTLTRLGVRVQPDLVHTHRAKGGVCPDAPAASGELKDLTDATREANRPSVLDQEVDLLTMPWDWFLLALGGCAFVLGRANARIA